MFLTRLFIYFAFRVIITLFFNLQRFLQKILTYKQKARNSLLRYITEIS